MRPPILILHATGTNRDGEAAWACEQAGGAPEIVHINRLVSGQRRLMDYRMLVLPGGFSYGDDLGAGKLWAVALRYRLAAEMMSFIAAGRPVLGICNGFQALVKAGLLPGNGMGATEAQSAQREKEGEDAPSSPSPCHLSLCGSSGVAGAQTVTLTRNDSARFECRWVYMQPVPSSPCVFTRGLDEPIYCPVAHGEGKFVARDAATLDALQAQGLVALRYAAPARHSPVPDLRLPPVPDLGGANAAEHSLLSGDRPVGYPWNPNGSQADIAGICNSQGTVLGLMPHPENHAFPEQHPRFHRGEGNMLGLPLFRNGVHYAANI